MTSRIGLLDWPGLAGIAAAMIAAAWLDQRSAVLLAGSVLAIGLVGRAWAALSLLALHYDRSLSADRGFPGDTIELRAEIDNRKPLPLSWVTVEEPAAPGLAFDAASTPVTLALGMYQKAQWRRSLACVKRGWYPLAPAILRSGDIFGLFTNERPAAEAASVIVYPRLRDMEAFGLSSRNPLGANPDPSRLFEDPTRPYGLRDYTPDTPFKAISWSATARRGELQVRTVDPTAALNIALMLDVDGFAGQHDDACFELAVSAAASLVMRLLDGRQPVGLFANGRRMDGHGDIAIAPGRGDGQRRLLLDALGVVEGRATEPFSHFLERHAADLRRGTTICVIAATLAEAAVLRLRDLMRRGYAVQLLWLGTAPVPEGLTAQQVSHPAGAEAA